MEYIKINKQQLEFDKIIYVETYGDDNNDGSLGSPVKTIKRAKELIKHGYCMKLGEGEFEIEHIELFATKFNYTVIGEAEKTIVRFDSTRTAYSIIQNVKTTLMRFILTPSSKYSNSGEKRVYFYIDENSKLNFDFYNVLFKLEKINGRLYPTQGDIFFSNSRINNNHSCYLVNCTIENTSVTAHEWCTQIQTFYNLAISYIKYNTSVITVDNSYVGGIKIDEQGNITNDVKWRNCGTSNFTRFNNDNPNGTQPHLGVYGGLYAWGNWKQYCVIGKDDEFSTIVDGVLTPIPDYTPDKFEDNKTTIDAVNGIINDLDNGYQIILKDKEDLYIKGIKQTSGLVAGKNDILTTMQRNIDYFKAICNTDDDSFIKIVFTMDSGNTWYTYNNGNFEEIDINLPLKPHAQLTDNEKQNLADTTKAILDKGIAYSELENLDFNGFNMKRIRFAYALSIVDKDSTCINRELQWRFDSSGNMIKMANSEYSIDLYGHKVDFKTKITNDLIKVNILSNTDGDEKDNLLYIDNPEIDILFEDDYSFMSDDNIESLFNETRISDNDIDSLF